MDTVMTQTQFMRKKELQSTKVLTPLFRKVSKSIKGNECLSDIF